jgi:hypothetical protein
MEEIWKDIKGWEGLYQVSNLGRVKRLKDSFYVVDKKQKREYYKTINEKIIKQHIGDVGYMELQLTNPHKKVKNMIRTHILIANAFINPIKNKYCVNHKDGNKLNNLIDNLEWCTQEENIKHAWKIGLCDNQKKRIAQIDINTGNVLKEFDSVMAAERHLKIKNLNKNFSKSVKLGNKLYGYKWKYL